MAAAVLVLVVHVLRIDRVCGLYSDDAWYVLLAKALATGHGYTLINAPTPGMVPYFPPGFPWVLSFVFRVAPVFPDNVWLLKSLSIAAMLGIGVLTERYARTIGLWAPLAGVVALATALHPGLVFLATSTVMSESVFTLVQLAVVLLVERIPRRDGAGGLPLAAGVLAGFGFLVRSLGAALALAGVLYLLKERRWRAATAYALAAAAVAVPWVLFARSHVPTLAQQAEMNDLISRPYGQSFWLRVIQDPSQGTISVGDLPARMWDGAQALVGRCAGAFEVYPMYRLLDPGAWSGPVPGATALSLVASLVIAIGFVAAARRHLGVAEVLTVPTLLVTAAWPSSHLRLVLPLLPFVLCYTALGVARLAGAARARHGRSAALAVMTLVLGVSLASHMVYVHQLRGPYDQQPLWLQLFDELTDVIGWARQHVPEGQVVAANHPAIVYLYSGHPTIGYDDPNGTWEQWRRLGVHYFVETLYTGHLSTLRDFAAAHRSPQLGLRVLELGRVYEPH